MFRCAAFSYQFCAILSGDLKPTFQGSTLLGLEKNQEFFRQKARLHHVKNEKKSENISPVLVSLLIIEVIGLNVDQIGLTLFDPDSDLVIFEAKSALVL